MTSPTAGAISVIVIDSQPIVRAGVAAVVATTADIALTLGVDSVADALRRPTHSSGTEVVITDLGDYGGSGSDRIAALRRAAPDRPILVFSTLPERPWAAVAIEVGASGFISRFAPTDQLIDAIRCVAGGDRYISAEGAQALAEHLSTRSDLTAREREVLRLLASGERISDVAHTLNISVKTASSHKANLQRKLGVSSLGGLIRYAIEQRLVPGSVSGDP